MTDILTPSECAKLSMLMEGFPVLRSFGADYEIDAGDIAITCNYVRCSHAIVEVMNATPRMLATIAAHEATIAELRGFAGRVVEAFDAYTRINQSESNADELVDRVAELRKELEERACS